MRKIHYYFLIIFFGFYPVNVLQLYGRLRATFFGVIQYGTWTLQYNKLRSFNVSASIYQLALLVVGRMTLIREYTALLGDSIAVQILTYKPSLSSVSQYPVAFELPRAEARHHQPDLPRAPTPIAFARASSLLHRHPPAYPVPYVSSLIIQHYR